MKQVLTWVMAGWLTLRLLPAAAQAAPPDVLLDETFQDDRRGWFVGQSAEWRVSLGAGEYRIDNLRAGGKLTWRPCDLNTDQDFTIETEMLASAGRLVWGGRDGANVNIVGLLPGQRLAVGQWRGGSWQWLTPAGGVQAASLREGDWNSIRLERRGPTVHYLANGAEVFSTPYAPLPGNLLGYQVESAPATLRMRRLRVWHHSRIKLAPGLPAGLRRERLGWQVNSRTHNDGAPVVSPDGQELYFSHWQPTSPSKSRILRARRQADGTWGPAEDVGPPLNNGGYNCPLGITPDGQALLVLNHYNPDGTPAPTGGCSLARRRPDGTWGRPEPLVIPGLPARIAYYYFYLAADGNTLVLAVGDEAKGPDDGDLYVTFRDAQGRWSSIRSLGPVVNSAGIENSPCLAPDGRTLYFASSGHPGYGDLDLFVSRRLDDSWTRWSEPLNLGPGINSEGSDACYSVGAAGDYAYLCSREWPETLEDIFRVQLPAAVRPDPTLLVRGQVLDARTGQPVPGAAVAYERLPDGARAGSARADGQQGRFQLVLPAGRQYGFRAEAPGYLAASDNLDLTQTRQYGEITQNLYLLPLTPPVEVLDSRTVAMPAGATPASAPPAALTPAASPAALPVREGRITLHNLFFRQGTPELLPASTPELDRLAHTLREHPSLRLRLDGHTDNTGDNLDPRPNQQLSQQRADAVKAYLVTHGVPAERLGTRGYGGSRPAVPNTSEANKVRNRRVECVVLGQ